MIDVPTYPLDLAQIHLAAGRLVASAVKVPAPLPTESAPRRWLEALCSELGPLPACGVIEHFFGVLPLAVARLPGSAVVAASADGTLRGGLALTNPRSGVEHTAAALLLSRAGSTYELSGALLPAQRQADGWLSLTRDESGAVRLVWLAVGTPGLTWPERSRWLRVESARVPAECLSESFEPGSDVNFCASLERYTLLWAFVALRYASTEIVALRRAARTTSRGAAALRASQALSLALGQVEFEIELANLAVLANLERTEVGGGDRGRLAATVAASRALAALHRVSAELSTRYGLESDGPLADSATIQALLAFSGGPVQIEAALAAAVGIDLGGTGPGGVDLRVDGKAYP